MIRDDREDGEEAVSPSLLNAIDWKKPVPIQFSLGMSEFVESNAFCVAKGKENKPLSLKKSRPSSKPLSLKKSWPSSTYTSIKRPRLALEPIPGPTAALEDAATAHNSSDRFCFQGKEKYTEMSIPFVPTNTRKNNDWAYNNFLAWREHRNMSFPDDPCPIDLIESPPWDTTAMAKWLPRYACETRNVSGGKYPNTSTIFFAVVNFIASVLLT